MKFTIEEPPKPLVLTKLEEIPEYMFFVGQCKQWTSDQVHLYYRKGNSAIRVIRPPTSDTPGYYHGGLVSSKDYDISGGVTFVNYHPVQELVVKL